MKYFLNTDYWFFLVVLVWLFNRNWPYGNSTQTALDILIIVVLVLIGANHYLRRE